MQPAVRDSLSSTLNLNSDQLPSPIDPAAAAADDIRVVRSIPPWVLTEEEEEDKHDQRTHLISPSRAIPASHHYLPEPPNQHKALGRKWDHLRSAEPALIDQPMEVNQERWLPYMLSGPHPRGIEGARYVSDAWMDENMPHLTQPWHSEEEKHIEEKEKRYWLLSRERRKQSFSRAGVCLPPQPLPFCNTD